MPLHTHTHCSPCLPANDTNLLKNDNTHTFTHIRLVTHSLTQTFKQTLWIGSFVFIGLSKKLEQAWTFSTIYWTPCQYVLYHLCWTKLDTCSPLTGMAILRNKIGEGCAAIIVDIWRKEKTLETMLNKHTETGLWGLLLELISNSQSIMSLPYLCLVLFPAFSACVEPVEGRKSFGAEQWLEFHWLTGEARFPVDSSTTKGRMGSTEWQQLWRPSWQH